MKEAGNTPNWVAHMYQVQCEVNNRPVQSRMDISPYYMYCSALNKSSHYSSFLGPAYKIAQMEYGLTFAKMFLKKVKQVHDSRVFTQEEVQTMIKHRDDAFNSRTSADVDMGHKYLSTISSKSDKHTTTDWIQMNIFTMTLHKEVCWKSLG
jgi:hypothetical protein